PTASRDRKRIGDVERIERVDAAVLIRGPQSDWSDGCGSAGWPEEYAAAADHKVRPDRAEFGARRIMRHAGIEAGSNDELIVVPEQFVVIGRLQRGAGRGR